MKKFVSLAIVFALSAAIAPADAQTVPTTTNVNAPQSSNQGVSNPVGENTNVQVNNNYSGMNSFGVGIQCATPYLAAGVFNNNTDITGGGVNVSNAGGNNTTGATLQFVIPVGGTQGSNCTALSNEIVKQRQLDTQITLIQRCAEFAKAGITLDSRVYPQLASACAGVKVAVATTNSAPAGTSGSSDEAAAQLPKLVVYSTDTKASPAPAPVAQAPVSVAQAPVCITPKVLTDRDKALLEQWKMSSEHQNSALQKSLTKKYRAELAADCIDAVAWAQ